MRKRGDDYIVQPVMKALQVLEHVARQSHEVTLTEIVSELKLPKTTVFRYLQTLSAASFLHHDQRRDRYGVGLRFRALAKADKNLQRLRVLAQPEMLGLMETFNETVNLGVLSDRHIVYVDMVEPQRTARIHARVGDRHPVHSTSLGKAIAAFLPEPRQDLFAEDALKAMTIKTSPVRRRCGVKWTTCGCAAMRSRWERTRTVRCASAFRFSTAQATRSPR